MWDLPGPGLEPVSPALAGRFSTTAPPGKPLCNSLNKNTLEVLIGGQVYSPSWRNDILFVHFIYDGSRNLEEVERPALPAAGTPLLLTLSPDTQHVVKDHLV